MTCRICPGSAPDPAPTYTGLYLSSLPLRPPPSVRSTNSTSHRDPTSSALALREIAAASSDAALLLLFTVPTSTCSMPAASVPGLALYLDTLTISGPVSASSPIVASKSSSVSPGNPTMTSVAIVNLPNLSLNAAHAPANVPAVWALFIAASTAPLPLCTGRWANLYTFSEAYASTRPPRMRGMYIGFIMPTRTLNLPGTPDTAPTSSARSAPMSSP